MQKSEKMTFFLIFFRKYLVILKIRLFFNTHTHTHIKRERTTVLVIRSTMMYYEHYEHYSSKTP